METAKIDCKPKTLKDIANIYDVSPKVMRKWLKKWLVILKAENRYFFYSKEVREIFEHLGEP